MNEKALAHVMALTLLCGSFVYAAENGHTHPHPKPEAVQPHEVLIPTECWDRLSIGFLMELEAFAAESGGVSESDLTLATLELTVDADIVEGVSGHLGLLWEEDDTEDNILDEGFLTFGATDSIPFYLTAGKMYLPFGNFESVFISDPLTLELAEIRESAALVGFANDWVDVNAGAFNGDFQDDTDDDTIDDAFASIACAPCEDLVFGACWLSDLLDTDGFETFADALAGVGMYEACHAAGVYVNAQIGPVTVNAEVVGAVEKIDVPGDKLRPLAYNIEASVPVHEKVAVGAKFEGSDDFFGDVGAEKWADEQYGFVASYALNDHITLSGEYLHAEGLDDDNSRDQATVQVAVVL